MSNEVSQTNHFVNITTTFKSIAVVILYKTAHTLVNSSVH